uniref:Site-specific DNA endonuclease I-CmuI n=1 Tax=Chlamydomonas mutabilis TaxID=47905 RepID=Q8WL13_9CHLO|nr:site-specific DNA endonuclease I-CmuI [Chlamydomonas mutabilis]
MLSNNYLELGPDGKAILTANIQTQLTKANSESKLNYPDYIKKIENIFSLAPLPSVKQEAKLFTAGFIEGEGSFNVSAKKTKFSKFGLVIDPEFSITQHVNGVVHLHRAMNIFNAGKIRYKAGSNATMVFIIDNRLTLTNKVLPYWEEYILPHSCPEKIARVNKFKSLLSLFDAGAHQTKESFMYKILPLWDEMRMQKGQVNETFKSLQDAQDFVALYKN